MKILVLLTFLIPASILYGEERYSFSSNSFQIGEWSNSTLTYPSGLSKIQMLDQWFYSLSKDEKEKNLDNFIINRNRLFLATQQKRLESELAPTISSTIMRKESAELSIRREKSQQLSAIKAMSADLLNNPEALKKTLFRKLDDVSNALPLDSNARANFGASLSKSFSKSVSKMGAIEDNRLASPMSWDLFLDQIDVINCHGERKCLVDQVKYKKAAEKRKKENEEQGALFEKLENTKKEKKLPEVPTCTPPEKMNPVFILDSENRPKQVTFLKELGITEKDISNKKFNDLSYWYSEPHTQWEKDNDHPNAACVGYAIASNVMAALYKDNHIKNQFINKSKDISPLHTYAAAKMNEYGKKADPANTAYCKPSLYKVSPYEGIQSVVDSIKVFSEVPLCQNTPNETKQELYKIDKFSAMEFKSKNGERPDFLFFKAMIDSGNPPIVGVDSDARVESAGWLNIKYGGAFSHVLNVVGYGEDINPMTLCSSKYFIVRDSLGKQKIHYKIPADNLLEHLDGIYLISKVHRDSETENLRKSSTSITK